MVRKILPLNDSSLHKRAREVVGVDKRLVNLLRDLEETLMGQKDPEGVGLCAPQIGTPLRVFVVQSKDKVLTFINPEITSFSKETNDPKEGEEFVMEGCLSLPHLYGPVERAARIKVRYRVINSRLELIEKEEAFNGFVSQVIQHERDHLEGITFVERLLQQKRGLYRQHGKHWHEVELP